MPPTETRSAGSPRKDEKIIESVRYRLLRTTASEAKDNEILVSSRRVDSNRYVVRAMEKFDRDGMSEITIRGLGQACTIVVEVAEVIRQTKPGLYKSMKIGMSEYTYVYSPVDAPPAGPNSEAESKNVSQQRTVGFLEITLSLKPEKVEGAQGYCLPCTIDEMKAHANMVALSSAGPRTRSSNQRRRVNRGSGGGGGGDSSGAGNRQPQQQSPTSTSAAAKASSGGKASRAGGGAPSPSAAALD